MEAFQRIRYALEHDNLSDRCFFLDGPGGTGKTYLYKTIMWFVRGRNENVLPFAITGIAATLLQGGRTVHSGFSLPVPLDETSVSRIKETSPEATKIRNAKLIIIDEITMLPKYGLQCIDSLLKNLIRNGRSFGGKIVTIGGDLRQTNLWCLVDKRWMSLRRV